MQDSNELLVSASAARVSFAPPDLAFILILESDGSAIVRENDVITLRTRFRTRMDGSAAGTPLVIEFDETVAGVERAPIDALPADVMDLEFGDGEGYHRFVRL